MKKVAQTSKPPVVIPLIVVLIDIHVPFVIPVIERGCFVQNVSRAIIHRRLVSIFGLYFIQQIYCRNSLHQVSSFFEVSTYITLQTILIIYILDVRILDSAERKHALVQIRLLPQSSVPKKYPSLFWSEGQSSKGLSARVK